MEGECVLLLPCFTYVCFFFFSVSLVVIFLGHHLCCCLQEWLHLLLLLPLLLLLLLLLPVLLLLLLLLLPLVLFFSRSAKCIIVPAAAAAAAAVTFCHCIASPFLVRFYCPSLSVSPPLFRPLLNFLPQPHTLPVFRPPTHLPPVRASPLNKQTPHSPNIASLPPSRPPCPYS